MPCRNLRLYQAQTIADLRVRSGMRDLESESLVGVSGKNIGKVEVCCQANAQYTNWRQRGGLIAPLNLKSI